MLKRWISLALLLPLLHILISGSDALPRPQNLDDYEPSVDCGGTNGAPLITPCLESVQLDYKTSYTLRCEAEEPVTWWYAHDSVLTEEFDNSETDPQRPYGAGLELVDVTAEKVGAYYCIKKSQLESSLDIDEDKMVEYTNDYEAVSIYVYVNDPNHLLVPYSPLVMARQYTSVVIPCKPTMPDTEVILQLNSETTSSKNAIRYNPMKGFTIEINGILQGGEYVCLPAEPSKDNDEEINYITVKFIVIKPIDRPEIKSSINHHVEKDSSFTLVCEQTDIIDSSYHMEWVTPIKDKSRLIITTPKFVKTTNTTHQVGRGTLTVEKAQLTDSGPYKCVVSNGYETIHSTYKLRVLEMNETYLRVYEPTNHYRVEGDSNKTIQMTANFEGYPIPNLYWHKPDGSEIHQTEPKFNIISTESSTTLKILSAQLEDSGTYVLRGENIYNTVNRQYNVSVKSGPVVSVSDVYVQVGGQAKLECYVRGHPLPIVSLNFYSCSLQPRWPNCENARENIDLTSKMKPGRLSVETIYEAIFTPTKPGIFSCSAMNSMDSQNFTANAKAHVMLGDIPSNMTIHGLDLNRKIARGDEENFTCEALAYHFNGDLKWYHNGEELVESEDVKIIRTVSQYSHKSTVHFSAIGDRDRGTYECRAHHIQRPSEYDRREVDVYIHEPQAPVWLTPNIPKKLKIERKLSQSLELECRSTAVPLATVRWFKDDKELVETNLTHILEDESKLFISHLYPRDDGVYTCQVENRLGKIEKSVTVIITDLPGINKGWVWFGIIMFLFLVSLCAFLAVRYHKEHKRHLALKAAGLANFEEGAVAHINPDLTLDEQAELLPYNREFEFPRDSLKLGKQLGAGAFGVVLKGEATGIRKEERITTVAVKMVKRTADDEVVRALVSELKIMVHLGQHLNVVNLLGAVTKNIAKRELMVIVEYCRFGNIQNFLLRNRKCFINQINSETDHIDPSITIQRESENFDLHRDANGGGGLKYANIGFPHHSYINHMNSVYNNNTHSSPHRRNSDNDPRSGTRAGRTVTGNATYSYDRQMDTCATVMTTVPEDDQVMSNNSVQPAWRSNYKTDVTEAMPVTTVDLISWAFQVARGMDYLSSKKVLHGDLAARNILLCEDNVVKICDFGLARSMYRGDNYKKSESGKLPIKWLALESLCDHVFSTYSDVWSFGIVLWEMFSLAKVPYPGIDPNQELFNKLNDGYRMEKPPYANQELYEIMLECWRKNPESRPLFNALEKRFANMLNEDVANHYLDLNNPYMQSNLEYMKKQETDYLALMGSPDEVAPSAPSYVNGRIVPDIRIESVPDDYQAMSPDQDSDSDACTAIFSQSRPEDGSSDFPDFSSETTFNFPAGSRQSPTLSNNMNNGASKLLRKKNGIPTVDAADQAPEEIPMLHRQSGGSDDGPDPTRRFNQALKQHYATPTPTPSPRHHVETKLNGEFSGSAAENYVNVKPPRKNIPGKSPVAGASTDAFSNPGYQPLSSASEKEQRRY
ncbi:hypothetical protein KR067_002519 [Drosophila pandora]|nr:hypothetical protein KR067_002519 [Drosophila pandora]